MAPRRRYRTGAVLRLQPGPGAWGYVADLALVAGDNLKQAGDIFQQGLFTPEFRNYQNNDGEDFKPSQEHAP